MNNNNDTINCKVNFTNGNIIVLSIALQFLFGIHARSQDTRYPSPKREMRAAWIATVFNIDWPSSKILSSDLQQQELVRILDELKQKGFNCVIIQVRCAADAFYKSGFEPWSQWLTGFQGSPPDPFYDPLSFILTEAHQRGMEVHAWFNPFRASLDTRRRPRIAVRQKDASDWFFTYGGKTLFNPGVPEVRDYIIGVVTDVVARYGVDGIHLDDYFYPYPEKRQRIRDGESFRQYATKGTSIEDWRRENINQFVHALHDSIRKKSLRVKIGISPFGIWKNLGQDSLGSNTHGGSTYINQFADSREWVKQGWVDYINPQIYFTTESSLVPFENLVAWWANNNFGRNVYIGLGIYKVNKGGAKWKDRKEIPNQIAICRKYKAVEGEVCFSALSVLKNPLGIADSMKNHYYRYPALVPRMPWLDSVPPLAPIQLSYQTGEEGISLHWKQPQKAVDGDLPSGYVVYRFEDNQPVDLENPAAIVGIVQDTSVYTDRTIAKGKDYFYVVTSLDRLSNESIGTCNVFVTAYR